MSCIGYVRILFIVIIFIVQTTFFCQAYNSFINQTYGQIQSLNLNQTIQWIFSKEQLTSYIFSFRILDIEYDNDDDRRIYSKELIFKTDQNEFCLTDINQRNLYISSTKQFEIVHRFSSLKNQSNCLNIRRFLVEFIQQNQTIYPIETLMCKKNALIIPKQWKCNCLNDCLIDDEINCSLCSIVKSMNNLICHSNEFWCLEKQTSKAICLQSEEIAQCKSKLQCEKLVTLFSKSGEIRIHKSLISNYQSLCFIIITNEYYRMKLRVNQFNFNIQRSNYEFIVYDGDEQSQNILISSNSYLLIQTVQTRQFHFATIVIRQRENYSSDNLDFDSLLLNITWIVNTCPDSQILCSGHYETKCYSKQQRCDGIWDCIGGDDELGCLPSSCPTTFACYNQLRLPSDQPLCYTWYERCNGNAFCPNRTDEQHCTNWWCNSNNGTFLCRNHQCIYESWMCDGADDCGDNSDEINCPRRISRRIFTALILGATICCTLFLFAMSCTCKLVQLRTAEQRASTRLTHRQQLSNENSQRMAPPSYNQTMGFTTDHDDRYTILVEQLRLAGLANFIPSRRNHRHQRNSDSREPLIELPSHPLDRLRSFFISPSTITTNESISQTNQSHELPPPYLDDHLIDVVENETENAIVLINIQKQQTSEELPLTTIQTNHDNQTDDDDEKLLMP